MGMRYQKNKARRTDGGNWNAHTVHGKHTRNPGYVPGQNWVECMRCGLDYRHSDIKREWTGLVVCKTCWEPRHPQDFVRARTDRIAAPGPNNTASEFSRVGAVGSTSVPDGTFNIGNPIGPGSDQPDLPLAPDALSTDLYGWYDFSLPTWSFTDDEGTVEVTDESNQERVDSRDSSPSGKELINEGSSQQGIWDANVQNGLGAFFATTAGGPSNASDLSANNPFSGPVLPQTVVGIVQIPAGDTVTRYWFGSDVSNGQQIGLSTNANGFAPELESQRTSPTPLQTVTRGSSSHAAYAGDWQMWMVEYADETDTTITINNVDIAGGAIEHDHLDFATNGVAIGNQNINGFDFPYYAWGAYIGEVIVYNGLLSTADKAALYTFLKNKWTLSSYP